LFNAGAGTVHNGGDVEVSYNSFTEQLMRLPYNTRIFPGHDYIASNLKFTLAREPGNAAAAALLPTVASTTRHRSSWPR
jgi:hydroxyacylglutathione hydrolase